MAELATVARPYAEAAFKAAGANLGAWSESLSQLAQLAANRDVANVIGNPKVSGAAVADMLGSLMKPAPGSEVKNFIGLLAKNDRVTLLPEIASQFESLKNDREGTVDATIFSAFEMDANQVAALAADIGKRFGRKINPQVKIDRELIGGVKVVVGDRVIDGSVKAKLESLRNGLKAA